MSDKALTAMTKAELLDAAEGLVLQVEGLQAELTVAHEAAEKKAAPSKAAAASSEAGVVMVVHLGGVEWNGTERRIVRCAPTGELAECWVVQIGERILLNNGRDSVPARPYFHLPSALQKRAQWSKDAAIQAALGA